MENIGLGPALQAFAMQLSDSGSRGHYKNGRGMTGPWDGPAGRPIGPELAAPLDRSRRHPGRPRARALTREIREIREIEPFIGEPYAHHGFSSGS